MGKIDTEMIKTKSTELITGLKRASSCFVAYNNKIADIESHTEYTREFRDSQILAERQIMEAQARKIFDDMYDSLSKMEEVMAENDNTYDFSDPEFSSCLSLLAAVEKPLPGETIVGIASKFLGNRQALLALAEVAKERNKQTLGEMVFNSEAEMAPLRDKIEDLDIHFPKAAYLIPDIRNAVLKTCKKCGQELSEQEADCGIDYQEIVNLQIRAAMGLLS